MLETRIRSVIRDVPDFPKPGIIFKDITPILQNQVLCNEIIEDMALKIKDRKVDAVAGIESRGFLFGFMLAARLNVPFVLIRKSGKLPYKTISCEYDLEYGTAKIEMHVDAIKPGWNVLIHDDLLATGGTAEAAARLIEMQNGRIAGFAFLVGLNFLNGDRKLKGFSDHIFSLVTY